MSIKIVNTTAPNVVKQEYFKDSTPTPSKLVSEKGFFVTPLVTGVKTFELSQAYISRETADGRTIYNPSSTLVNLIKGKTVKTTNLIPFPYLFGSSSNAISGITRTVNADGSITLSGTHTGSDRIAWQIFPYRSFNAGTYTLSSGVVNENVYLHFQFRNNATGQVSNRDTKTGSVTFTISEAQAKNFSFNLYLWINPGANCDGITIYPMLNDGPTVKPFVPYFSGLKHANFKAIKSTGKQLIPFPYRVADYGTAGVSFHANDDGSISLSGTATGRAIFTIHEYTALNKNVFPAGVYYISCAGRTDIKLVCEARNNDKWVKDLNTRDQKMTIDWNGYDGIRMLVNVVEGTVCDGIIIYPMLNFGATKEPFKPYKVEEYGDGNAYDLPEYDYINPQTSELVKGTRTIVFNGTEYWRLDSINEYGIVNFVTNILSGVGRANIGISNYYDLQKSILADTTKTGFFYNGSGLYFREISYLTEEAWKAHLAELYANGTPLMIEIELLTPTIETLTDYPKGYTADNGGSETVKQGNVDNSQWGAICEITNTYVESYTQAMSTIKVDYSSYKKECGSAQVREILSTACKVYGDDE